MTEQKHGGILDFFSSNIQTVLQEMETQPQNLRPWDDDIGGADDRNRAA